MRILNPEDPGEDSGLGDLANVTMVDVRLGGRAGQILDEDLGRPRGARRLSPRHDAEVASVEQALYGETHPTDDVPDAAVADARERLMPAAGAGAVEREIRRLEGMKRTTERDQALAALRGAASDPALLRLRENICGPAPDQTTSGISWRAHGATGRARRPAPSLPEGSERPRDRHELREWATGSDPRRKAIAARLVEAQGTLMSASLPPSVRKRTGA